MMHWHMLSCAMFSIQRHLPKEAVYPHPCLSCRTDAKSKWPSSRYSCIQDVPAGYYRHIEASRWTKDRVQASSRTVLCNTQKASSEVARRSTCGSNQKFGGRPGMRTSPIALTPLNILIDENSFKIAPKILRVLRKINVACSTCSDEL